jgi:hypothetical protein
MAGIVLRILAQLTLTLAALLGAQYSLFNWATGSQAALTDPIRFTALGIVLFEGQRQEVEVRIRIILTAIACAILFVHEAVA